MPEHRKWEDVKAEMRQKLTPEELEFHDAEQDRLRREMERVIEAYRREHPEEILRNAAEMCRVNASLSDLHGLLAVWLDAVADEMVAVSGTEYELGSFPSWDAASAVARLLVEPVT